MQQSRQLMHLHAELLPQIDFSGLVIGQDRGGVALGDDVALAHDVGIIRDQAGLRYVMRHDDRGDAECFVQLLDQLGDELAESERLSKKVRKALESAGYDI